MHLVLSDSAAGCLRAACASYRMPGAVFGLFGDLAQGSLDGEELLAQWWALTARLEAEHPDAVIVWSGDNVADATFVAMACDQLAGRPEPLLRVRVPAIDRLPFVAMHMPQQLAQLYATRQPLSDADRLSLAQDFTRMRETCGPVRRLQQGRVQGVPVDFYDPLLLEACTTDWQAAGSVVGAAMAHCDAANLLGDGFFSARLGAMLGTGRVEAKGVHPALRDDSIRLTKVKDDDWLV